MPFPGTTVLCVPHLPLGYRSRVPFCPFVLADSAGLLPGWDIIPSQRTRCNRAPSWTSALHHRFPISCDPALSFVPEPHHLTWLYPPLSCLGYCVWNPHKPHLLPGYHHALWPNCPTSATSNFQPNQASHAALAQAERIQHPHSSIGSRFRKGGHLWIAIRPVRPAHRLQNKSYADNACRLPVTNQRQGLELLLGGKDIVFLQIRERKDSPTTSISQSQPVRSFSGHAPFHTLLHIPTQPLRSCVAASQHHLTDALGFGAHWHWPLAQSFSGLVFALGITRALGCFRNDSSRWGPDGAQCPVSRVAERKLLCNILTDRRGVAGQVPANFCLKATAFPLWDGMSPSM